MDLLFAVVFRLFPISQSVGRSVDPLIHQTIRKQEAGSRKQEAGRKEEENGQPDPVLFVAKEDVELFGVFFLFL